MRSRTVKYAHGQPRHKYDCSWTIYGSYRDHPRLSRILPSSRIIPAVLNFPKLPCWPPGTPRRFPNVQGPTRIDTELHVATRVTCQIEPDLIRFDPESVWDWGLRSGQLRL
ncbi:hypothetical protein DPMN_129032 [Dreissena polymorpha]|uniref:Uncharacterized protein n=1 Tax=Dreissena polymorpha TaxID=45954 RepID=A0A9D4K0P9_DREPO|nr:hypothetical protein DPMN_127483 [Dreissena polymorpha]KAH3827103.1 hypothetical protein DPMN_129032 [Dreissena polymorpha]